MKQIHFVSLFVMVSTFQSVNSADPSVTIDYGKLEGTVVKTKKGDCDAYVGVPFAAPPTGPLRWAKPQEPTRWDGVKEAKSFKPKCMQGAGAPPGDPREQNEDCLYLNIFIPKAFVYQSGNASLPVMVWIHGGGMTSGTAQDYGQSGPCENLATRGVIIVTIQYRLSVFGFYTTGDKTAPGNYAIWDQIEALKWVKKNIKHFGGDPNKVTIFGESTGGVSISYLTYTPAAQDYFHQSIGQSGSAQAMFTGVSNKSVEISQIMAKKANCPTGNSEVMTKCLQQIQATELLKIDSTIPETGQFLNWIVRADGELYKETELKDLKNGKPAIIGNVEYEYAPNMAHIANASEKFDKALNDLRLFVGKSAIETEVLKQAIRYVYIDSQGDRNNKTFVAQQIAKMFTGYFASKAALEATRKADAGRSVWVYHYNYYSENVFPATYPFRKGATHATEVCYLFLMEIPDSWRQFITWCPLNYDGNQGKVADYLGEMWTNFAIKGNPSPKNLDWPNFHNVSNANTMFMGSELYIEPTYFLESAKFWNYLKPNIERAFQAKGKF